MAKRRWQKSLYSSPAYGASGGRRASRLALTLFSARAQVVALSLQKLAQRFALLLVLLLAVAVTMVSQQQAAGIAAARGQVLGVLVPVWQALAAPLQTINAWQAQLVSWQNLQTQNAALQAENLRLRTAAMAATQLAAENQKLTALLGYIPPPAAKLITARVLQDVGGMYQQALLVQAGYEDGIEIGMAALGATGVVGRVIEVGPKAARVLLLTDVNARIPARLQQSGVPLVVAGQNEPLASMLYLPRDVVPGVGDMVVTSGQGGVFPANLPLGTVVADGAGFALQPLEDLSTLEYIRLVDYRLAADTAR